MMMTTPIVACSNNRARQMTFDFLAYRADDLRYTAEKYGRLRDVYL